MERPRLRHLSHRILAPILVLTVLLIGLFIWLLRYETDRSRMETVDAYSRVVGQLVMSHLRDAMQEMDRERLQREVIRLAEMEPIHGVRVVDKKGKIRFASTPREIGSSILKGDPGCTTCHIEGERPAMEPESLTMMVDGHTIVRAIDPILVEEACTECHKQPLQSVLGVLITDLDEDALTGDLRARTDLASWFAAGLGVIVLGSLLFLVRGIVEARIRTLRRTIDRLRAGGRTEILPGDRRDEIDDLAGSMQGLVIDLDGQVSLQREAGILGRVLEGHPGPLLLMDGEGRVLAANRRGIVRFHLGDFAWLAGRPRRDLPDPTGDLMEKARDRGWGLAGEDGPVVVALPDGEGEIVGFLEVWSREGNGGQADPVGAFAMEDREWLMYATSLVARVRPEAKEWKGVETPHPLLLVGGGLARELREAASAMRETSGVDLRALVWLAHRDAQRRREGPRWHVLERGRPRVRGVPYRLRLVLDRLLRAAELQAGEGGHGILFLREDAADGAAFLGAWASRTGGEILLDPVDGPPVTAAICRAHGGGVEVDPEFDVGPLAESFEFRLSFRSKGTLYVCRLPRSP